MITRLCTYRYRYSYLLDHYSIHYGQLQALIEHLSSTSGSMSVFPTTSSPFGPLEPIHAYILSNTEQLSWSNWWKLLVIPFIPLYLQALLLRREHTRKERVALAALGLGLLWHAGLRYRFLRGFYTSCNFPADALFQSLGLMPSTMASV